MAPRTVRGLLTAFEELDPANVAEVAAALDQIAARLDPPPPPRPRDPGYPHGYGPNGIVKASTPPPGPSPIAVGAAKLARQLAGMVRQIPAVIVALRSATAAPVPGTTPLYVPDDVDPLARAHAEDCGEAVYRDAGTGEPAPSDHAEPPPVGSWVRWWPALSSAALQLGYTALTDVPIDDLVVHFPHRPHRLGPAQLNPAADLIDYATTLAQFRGRDVGWHEYARSMRGGGHHAAARQRARGIARAYRDVLPLLVPIGDRLAADLAGYLETNWSALTALTETQGETMPTLASSAVVTSLATRIRDAITSGHGGRLAVGDGSEVAFSYLPAQAQTLLTHLNKGTVSGRHATVVTAKNAATVVGPVAEGGTKPSVVTFTSADVDLQKYAGLVEMSTESANYVTNIEAAVSSIMVSQITRAIEHDAVTAITAGAGVVITAAADITAGVLAAQAGIRENGGTPTVVGLSSADWLTVFSATGAGGFVNFASAESGPGTTWLGLFPVIIPGQPAGSAIVLDGSCASVLEPAGGPLCVVDVYSKLSTNTITIAVEEWAVTSVTSPGGVATVAVTP